MLRFRKRIVKKVILIFGEGLRDFMFIKHLKQLYCFRDSDVSIKVDKGKGGSPSNIVSDANKVMGEYIKRIVVLDNDRTDKEMKEGRIVAKRLGIKIIENTPCLEFMLLKILGKRIQGDLNSVEYKKEFEMEYIKRSDEMERYMSLFPKPLLNRRRKEILELNSLLNILENDV